MWTNLSSSVTQWSYGNRARTIGQCRTRQSMVENSKESTKSELSLGRNVFLLFTLLPRSACSSSCLTLSTWIPCAFLGPLWPSAIKDKSQFIVYSIIHCIHGRSSQKQILFVQPAESSVLDIHILFVQGDTMDTKNKGAYQRRSRALQQTGFALCG